ncbi:M1-specific T cell receptor alpha chain-like isoform X1 [Mugil cephalus]|uniref:M1-specific T cell receptor alpha chain-like isoform X1 n=1 Tax=Mugil cephalus TaxID=48193 RepID=UPI001FB5AFC8|nr:M1-specific T cell receptor alpha chain-like isoform X1 [Mugil cephalus]
MDLVTVTTGLSSHSSGYCHCFSSCVNNNDFKVTFGPGTRLSVFMRQDYEPSYYALGNGTTEVCLATGFSRYKATHDHPSYGTDFFNKTSAVLISSDSLYNQVIFTNDDDYTLCEGKSDHEKCVDALDSDPTVNLVSLTILGLRVIFLKTIIFNVLMTLRLWIS